MNLNMADVASLMKLPVEYVVQMLEDGIITREQISIHHLERFASHEIAMMNLDLFAKCKSASVCRLPRGVVRLLTPAQVKDLARWQISQACGDTTAMMMKELDAQAPADPEFWMELIDICLLHSHSATLATLLHCPGSKYTPRAIKKIRASYLYGLDVVSSAVFRWENRTSMMTCPHRHDAVNN